MEIKPNPELAHEWARFGQALGGKITELRQMSFIMNGCQITEEGLDILQKRLAHLVHDFEALCKVAPERLDELYKKTQETLK